MDRWGEEEGKESDARPPISQGFVIKGGGVVFSVSVTLKVNKTNGTTVKNLHWAKRRLSEICVCALAARLKKKKRTDGEAQRLSALHCSTESGSAGPQVAAGSQPVGGRTGSPHSQGSTFICDRMSAAV